MIWVKLITLIALLGAVAWLVQAPDWEPGITAATLLAGLIAEEVAMNRSSKSVKGASAEPDRSFKRQQLDYFYAPVLSKLDSIRALGKAGLEVRNAILEAELRPPREDTENTVAYDNRTLRNRILPTYEEIRDLYEAHRALVEPSTASLYDDLVAFIDLWTRIGDHKLSFETLHELQERGVARDPQEKIRSDVEEHLFRLRQELA